MRRREFISVLGGAAACSLVARGAAAQTSATDRTPTILFINVSGARGSVLGSLQRALQGLGYTPSNHRFIVTDPSKATDFRPMLKRRQVDVIFASSPDAVLAAREIAAGTQIVALDLETDPVAVGWIESYPRPGRNLTGIFLDQPALAAKWLQLIKEAVPNANRIAVFWDRVTGTSQRRAIEVEAPVQKIELRIFEYGSADLDRLFAQASSAACNALVILSSPQVVRDRFRLAELANAAVLPSISMFPQYAQAGGLFAYGVDPATLAARAAIFVDKILKGQKASEIPVELPTAYKLIVNIRTAKALRLTIPDVLLARADEVIE